MWTFASVCMKQATVKSGRHMLSSTIMNQFQEVLMTRRKKDGAFRKNSTTCVVVGLQLVGKTQHIIPIWQKM